jgi:hypothetical protein
MEALTGLDWRTDPSRNECASLIRSISEAEALSFNLNYKEIY